MEKGKIMRLIDADAVLAKQFTTGLSDTSGNHYGNADVVFADDIENAPTVDAVEVVRCKDCVSHGNCDSERVFTFYCGISNPFCCAGRWKRNS